MCSGSEEGSYLRLIDFVYHSTLGVRVMKKKKYVARGAVGGRGSEGDVDVVECEPVVVHVLEPRA